MFVGNLPETTAAADLRQLFGAYGVVARVHLLQEQDSNQEPGMGFVERAYWIPGSYAPTLSENHNSFLRTLKNKGFRGGENDKSRVVRHR